MIFLLFFLVSLISSVSSPPSVYIVLMLIRMYRFGREALGLVCEFLPVLQKQYCMSVKIENVCQNLLVTSPLLESLAGGGGSQTGCISAILLTSRIRSSSVHPHIFYWSFSL